MLLFDRGATLASCLQASSAAIAISLTLGVACNVQSQSKPTSIPPSSVSGASIQAKPRSSKPRVLPMVRPAVLPLQLHPYVNCAVEKCLALTFDDGPDPRTTPQLLNILHRAGARATFFVLGSQVQKYPNLTRQVEAAGHQIGNHSWGHNDFTQLKPQQIKDDIAHTQQTIELAGVQPPYLFRPPFGAHDSKVDQAVPMSLALWSVDPEDWAVGNPDELARRVIEQAKPGGIVVLHDIQPTTVAAAIKFVPKLRQKYHLVTVGQLMGISSREPKTTYVGR